MAPRPLPLWLLRRPEEAKVLRAVSDPVSLDQITEPNFQALIDQMIVTMYAARGVGLAAPQIGQSIRLAVIAKDMVDGAKELVMINPVVTPVGTKEAPLEQGCLSIPGVYGQVRRPAQVQLKALDRHGQVYTLTASGFFSQVVQHELDHLNGKLFIDRVDQPLHGA